MKERLTKADWILLECEYDSMVKKPKNAPDEDRF